MGLGFNSTIAIEFPPAETHPMFYVGIFTAIGLGVAILSTINSIVLYIGSYRASKRLFSSLLDTVVRAPMRWFVLASHVIYGTSSPWLSSRYDTTPSGRIINRFSRDVETIDSSLSNSVRSTTHWAATILFTLVTVAVVLPPFLVPAVFIG